MRNSRISREITEVIIKFLIVFFFCRYSERNLWRKDIKVSINGFLKQNLKELWANT